jgi:F-type H+-transporting ATPase subunit c
MDVEAVMVLAPAIIKAAAYLGAGLAVGIGAIGPALGEGYIGGRSCESISRRPEQSGLLTRTMVLADAIAETTGVYSLIISLILIIMAGRV